jgi:hypothetical protein
MAALACPADGEADFSASDSRIVDNYLVKKVDNYVPIVGVLSTNVLVDVSLS